MQASSHEWYSIVLLQFAYKGTRVEMESEIQL